MSDRFHELIDSLSDYGHPDARCPIGALRAADLGKWIVADGLDCPKQIIRLIHNAGTTSVQWYRDPVKRDAMSGMVARHDHLIMLYRADPTLITPPEEGSDR